ncbi:dihydrolipoyllysine-residue acetyltransferase component 3 of pyruvatedehydrogenase complex [Luminiphilus syltensis NOR5-1B]|uniref:Dihydrolipoamide acetyltransferase component of pyruvate dehydrogenase complex n=1 Tax=Luminiphilus syltensis NOR5-1B TaxID=565045 RepID=B8KTY7_9GAMM|nr:dihydrolipoamide acetyltransferase family protein [Luminiphilus syltensis]EED36412.1 dihydrolipoyllysine-residue acetyltransferase component 3 of pyruvatedehydrogenase complex [Luminiphilus syltensis NOR5-1B]
MTDSIKAFTMPKWGMEMQDGTVEEWLVAEGDAVVAGQAIVVVETEKIANEVEVDTAGVVRRIIAQTGELYPVGAMLAVIADAGVSDDAVDAFIGGSAPGAESKADAPGASAAPTPKSEHSAANKAISPKAEALAMQLSIDVASVEGTGRKGRITLQDIEQAAKARGLFNDDASSGPEFERVALTSRQRTAAKRLTEAKRDIPHFYLERTLPLAQLVEFRAARKAAGSNATLNDYMLRACAQALAAVPEVNAQLQGDEVLRFRKSNIAVAMQVDSGLITPVVRDAGGKSASEIGAETRRLHEAASSNSLAADDIKGATFTVSNLGMHGIDRFCAIINPPAVAILAVGSVAPRVLPGSDAPQSSVNVTLSCDHRVVDGVLGAQFLQALHDAVQAPEKLDY